MPPVRRRPKTRLHDFDCMMRVRERLLSGHDFDFLPGLSLDDAELATAWKAMRQSLLAEWFQWRPPTGGDWGKARGQPGTRPAAWWKFDSPDCLAGDETPDELVERFGYQDQATYLASKNLLTPAEVAALAKGTFQGD